MLYNIFLKCQRVQKYFPFKPSMQKSHLNIRVSINCWHKEERISTTKQGGILPYINIQILFYNLKDTLEKCFKEW